MVSRAPAATWWVVAATANGVATVGYLSYRIFRGLRTAPARQQIRDSEERYRRIVETTSEDVTSQRALEARLRQAQKLEAVGQLAGGIAHDFNNLLTVIDGYAAVLLAVLDPARPERRHAEQIRDAAGRATALTRQLLQFSSRQPTEPRRLDLNEVVNTLHDTLRRQVPAEISLVLGLAAAAQPVRIDRDQLDQVVVNLVVNARDAMSDGGQLTVGTGRVHLAAPAADGPRPGPGSGEQHRLSVADTGLEAGEYVRLTVADTGHGMTAEVSSRAFEPFFTTKGPGKGTGLGLATAYGIVRKAAGHIDIQSEPGAGTTVSVLLPLDRTPAPEAEPAGESPAATGRATDATVLLVEDDPAVRGLAQQILADAGYTVVTATDGEQALRLYGAPTGEPGHIDVLLTDVMMPGMSGIQLAARLSARTPGLPMVFMSAYAHGLLADLDDSGETPICLDKPFTSTELLDSLQAAMRDR